MNWLANDFIKLPNPPQGAAIHDHEPLIIQRRNYWASLSSHLRKRRIEVPLWCALQGSGKLSAVFNARCKVIATGPAEVDEHLLCCVHIKKQLVVSPPPPHCMTCPVSAVSSTNAELSFAAQSWVSIALHTQRCISQSEVTATYLLSLENN